MRFSNTAGPIRPDDHYYIPPLERLDLDGVCRRRVGTDGGVYGSLHGGVGHLVIFDRRAGRRWDDKMFYSRRSSANGVAIEV